MIHISRNCFFFLLLGSVLQRLLFVCYLQWQGFKRPGLVMIYTHTLYLHTHTHQCMTNLPELKNC